MTGFFRGRSTARSRAALLLLILSIPSPAASAFAASLINPNGRTYEIVPGLYADPSWKVQGRTYYYGSDPGDSDYCLENSEGDCLTEGPNTFGDLTAGLTVNRILTLEYAGQISDQAHRTKRAFAKVRTGIVSWEFGKDSLWIGHGVHGSFLLSNNAEGFLMFKFQTEDPFRLPWVFSKIGSFRYLLFHGWMEDFRLFGHRLEYLPVPIVQIGMSQTAFYNGRYRIGEFYRIISASEENVPGKYDTDQRASMDIALYLPIVRRFSPLVDAKIYAELAGEDLVAPWQKEDREFVKPFGFKFFSKAAMGGLFLTTGVTELRIEYSQNYRSGDSWYQKYPFANEGVPLGHHMGREADDLYIEIARLLGPVSLRFAFDRERHGVHNHPDRPEVRDQFIFIPSYSWKRVQLFANLIYSHYRNVDTNPDPFVVDPEPGTERDEYTIGVGITVR